ncbi:uncharacterized protein LOC122261087 [Penaeus japonicus]|uniref:uncharacterized protein LOC122261087 n=1 Tax=Penaeus japonicus TaxID=27405 RepID=UPI001C70BBBD|nr:uncharacterized protein LOC122261087 [Penaeus japonicus]
MSNVFKLFKVSANALTTVVMGIISYRNLKDTLKKCASNSDSKDVPMVFASRKLYQLLYATLLFMGFGGREADHRSRLCTRAVVILLSPWVILTILLLLLYIDASLLIVTLSLIAFRILYLQSKVNPNKMIVSQRCRRLERNLYLDLNSNVLILTSDEEELEESSEGDFNCNDSFYESCCSCLD